MNATAELNSLTDELAAEWTEPVLQMIAAVAKPHPSIELELQAWRLVSQMLLSELVYRRHSSLHVLPGLMKRVLGRAADQLRLQMSLVR